MLKALLEFIVVIIIAVMVINAGLTALRPYLGMIIIGVFILLIINKVLKYYTNW